MDNECHANICVFVQNSPDPPIYTFWSYDSHRDRVIKSLKFETNVNVHSCLSPVAPPPPHVRMCPLLLKPLLPILRTSFMDDP